MNKRTFPMGAFIFLIIVIFVVYTIRTYINNDDKAEINSWASNNETKVLEIDEKFFEWGPFYFKAKHQRIYKVCTDKGIYWFRFGLSSPDIEKDNNERTKSDQN